jgi:uncharacterized membrane protein YccC
VATQKAKSALAAIVRSTLRVERSKLAIDVGARTAVGVAIPLVAGQLAGHPVAGATAATGALTSGFASLQGTYRSRAAIVLAAAFGFAFAAFVGGSIGHVLGPDLVATALAGFVAGLAVSLGTAATVVGMQTVIGLVVFSQFSFPVGIAAREAGIVFLGGILQTVLVVGLWPFGRSPAERRALGAAFDALASHCRDAAEDPEALLAPAALDAVSAVMRDPQPFRREQQAAMHRALVDQADRIRLELAAVSRSRQQLQASGDIESAATVGRLLRAAAYILSEVAEALREGRVPMRWEDARDRFESALADLCRPAATPQLPGWRQAVASEAGRRGEALAGQLRAAVRLAAVPAGGNAALLEEAVLTGRAVSADATRRRAGPWVGDVAATLRANLAMSSQSFRHGMRLAVALAVAVSVSHLFPQGHRYWVPMTVMIVLKPDFGSTFTRGISRVIGTLLGAGVVTFAVAELRPGPAGLTVLAVVFCFGAATLLLANYAAYSVCVASVVVTLLAFNGAPEVSVAGDRSLFTAVGAAIALVAYVVWPTWEASGLPDRLAHLIDTEGSYGRAVLAAWADPTGADRVALQHARLNARLARSNAEAAVGRWLSEPDRVAGLERDTVLGLMAAVRGVVQGLLALHAQLPAEGPGRPDVYRLADGYYQAMAGVASGLAAGLRDGGGRAVEALPPLRSIQLDMARGLGFDGSRLEDAPGSPGEEAVTLVGETDLIVNSVNTLGHLLGMAAP